MDLKKTIEFNLAGRSNDANTQLLYGNAVRKQAKALMESLEPATDPGILDDIDCCDEIAQDFVSYDDYIQNFAASVALIKIAESIGKYDHLLNPNKAKISAHLQKSKDFARSQLLNEVADTKYQLRVLDPARVCTIVGDRHICTSFLFRLPAANRFAWIARANDAAFEYDVECKITFEKAI